MTRLGHRSRIVLTVSAILLFVSSLVKAQTLTNWKPNVGDKFICTVSHYASCGDYYCEGLDTMMFEVKDTSYNYDKQHAHLVRLQTIPVSVNFTMYFWSNGYSGAPEKPNYPDTTFMSWPFGNTLQTSFHGFGHDSYRYWTDLTFDRDTSIVVEGKTFSAAIGSEASFSSDIGWFISLSGWEGAVDCAQYCTKVDWHMTLLAAIKANSVVQSREAFALQVLSRGGTLKLLNATTNNFTLSDILGRPVRSWQLAASDGPREITLNVADVPSGVYFLRLQGGGVDEVKRVAIIH